jgi:molybdate transport system substrate-binding protein
MADIVRAFLAGLACVLGLALAGGRAGAEAVDPPVIAAAADLNYALAQVAEDFKASTGRAVLLTFGSSGNFATQIQNGAPFQMFLSADESYVRLVAGKGLTEDDGTLYAIGRIVLFTPNGSPIAADGDLKDLAAGIADGRLLKLAIANPEHAPYGRAAREALIRAGLWDSLQGKLVFGENASQAAQYAASGSTQGGIIPYSLALAPAFAGLGRSALVSADWHEPLRQRMVLLKGAGETARAFYGYLQQPEARAVLKTYGFVLPGDTN